MIAHAEGPIPGGQTLTGTLTDTSDIDYYVFYANGQQTVTVARASCRRATRCASPPAPQ